jgi:hypothetical protein
MKKLESGRLLTMTEAAQHPLVTRMHGGKPVSPMTIWRWARRGSYGVRLEVVPLKGTEVVRIKEKALARFLQRIDAIGPDKRSSPSRSGRRTGIPAGRVSAKAAG